ncbi:MAG: outer membrane protein assembly factor BamD [Burkholderiales bacterium]
MMRSVTIFALLCLALLAACSSPGGKDEKKNWTAEDYYKEAKEELDGGNYERAIKLFEQVGARYPFGRVAQQSQLEIAYSYYKQSEVTESVAAADRFIKQYPTHENLDYAFYLKGLANFRDDKGFLGILNTTDLSERDPKAARDAFDAFKELVTRFPQSRYAEDSTKRMNYLVNSLALNEIHVARYYLKRGAPLAAANRAQQALLRYPQAPALEEALGILISAYDNLGMADLRDDAKKVLQKNFPQSAYLAGYTEANKAWWKFW